jgi:hypothetical protein
MNKKISLISARFLIGIVALFNLQCALVFLISPSDYAPGFELAGVPGEVMVRGLGVLFLMWTIPSLFALSNPIKRRVSLIEAVLMQGVGLVGESLMLLSLPAGYAVLRETATRFIMFDGGGLVMLMAALFLSSRGGLIVELQQLISAQ